MRRSLAIVGAVTVTLAAGCSVRVLAPSERDGERASMRALQEEGDRLRAENAELRAKLDEQATRSANVAPEVLANAPVAVQLTGGFGSATVGEPTADQLLLILHLEPLDARARFVQVTGWVDVSVVAFPLDMPNAGSTVTASGSLPAGAREIASIRFEPGPLRDALRTGLFGIYYALECPIPVDRLDGMSSLVARIAFRDGFTERRLDAVVLCPSVERLLATPRPMAE